MSIIEELGARVRAAADDLPIELLAKALEHLRVASDRLRWVRQASANPMGVPELSAATEHAQLATHALRVAQEQLAAYLAAIGLAGGGSASGPPPATGRPVPPQSPTPEPARRSTAPTVHRWWSARVAELTGRDDPPPADGRQPAMDTEDLLFRVTDAVRSGDRVRVSAELRQVEANVGLGLAAAAAPRLRRSASGLLGHPPGARDLPRLRQTVSGKVRELLPGLPPEVLETILSRLCRTPPPKHPYQPHEADQAVATAVLAGLLDDGGHEGRRPPAEQRRGRAEVSHG